MTEDGTLNTDVIAKQVNKAHLEHTLRLAEHEEQAQKVMAELQKAEQQLEELKQAQAKSNKPNLENDSHNDTGISEPSDDSTHTPQT